MKFKGLLHYQLNQEVRVKVKPGISDNFFDSECVSCGACVQACPTGSLIKKSVEDKGMPNKTVLTTCAYCGVGCSFKAEIKDKEVVRMVPYKGGSANKGHSCIKGRFVWGFMQIIKIGSKDH
ncbi:MAG: hypothetical protein Ct9H90mP13_09990 [Pseudomonadota bacterium]|nr:MAG: hypothetical protein Ct9H90mP13_09990 [Pseudomonadota bacterium]